jgi:hypothetical protein
MIPIVIALGLMVPRVLEARFGFLDDGVTVTLSRQIHAQQWDPAFEAGQGRFRPVYWLYFALVSGVARESPVGFFLGNTALLVLTSLGVMRLVRTMGGSQRQAWMSSVLFVLSGPVIESYFTLSKGEPLQVLFITAGLILGTSSHSGMTAKMRIVLGAGAVAAFLLADLSKETSLVVLPIAALTAGFQTILARRARAERSDTMYLVLIAATCGAAIFFLLQSMVAGRSLFGGNYSGRYVLSAAGLLQAAVRWVGWLLRDYGYLLPLCLLPFLGGSSDRAGRLRFVLGPLIWMAGWIAVYLPWTFSLEYYLLPFSIGASLLAGYSIEAALRPGLGFPLRLRSLSASAAAGALFLSTLGNNFSAASLQLMVDEVNQDFVTYLGLSLPPGAMLRVNLPSEAEYLSQLRLHLSLFAGRQDVRVSPFAFQVAQAGDPDSSMTYFVASPWIGNQYPHHPRLGLEELEATSAKRALESFLGSGSREIYSILQEFQPLVFDPSTVVCLWLKESQDCRLVRREKSSPRLSYGWTLYSVASQLSESDQPGMFHDGVWSLRRSDGATTTAVFGRPGDAPVVGDWDGDGHDGLGVCRPSEGICYLRQDLGDTQDIRLALPGMGSGTIAFAGDWDGDGADSIGYYSPSSGEWVFLPSAESTRPPLTVRGPRWGEESFPIVGDWDSDGSSGIGIYRPTTGHIDLEDEVSHPPSGVDVQGPINHRIVSGDWGGLGSDRLGFVKDGQWTWMFGLCDCKPYHEPTPFLFGDKIGVPVAGHWSSLPSHPATRIGR